MAVRWSVGLQAFVATVETGSFRAAARRLGVTPTAVSRAVARLEEELDVQLLDRSPRAVSPTRAGEVLLLEGRRALDILRAAEDRVATEREAPSGTLTMSASAVLARPLVTWMARLRSQHPGLELELRLEDRQADLLAEGVDVALRIGPLPDSSLVAHRLAPLDRCVVASPAYLARHGTPRRPDDLDSHVCLHFLRPRGGVHAWALRPARKVPATPIRLPAPVRIDSGEELVEAARAGVGLAFAFRTMVEDDLASGVLVSLLEPFLPEPDPLTALLLPGRQSAPRIRAALDVLDEVLGR